MSDDESGLEIDSESEPESDPEERVPLVAHAETTGFLPTCMNVVRELPYDDDESIARMMRCTGHVDPGEYDRAYVAVSSGCTRRTCILAMVKAAETGCDAGVMAAKRAMRDTPELGGIVSCDALRRLALHEPGVVAEYLGLVTPDFSSVGAVQRPKPVVLRFPINEKTGLHELKRIALRECGASLLDIYCTRSGIVYVVFSDETMRSRLQQAFASPVHPVAQNVLHVIVHMSPEPLFVNIPCDDRPVSITKGTLAAMATDTTKVQRLLQCKRIFFIRKNSHASADKFIVNWAFNDKTCGHSAVFHVHLKPVISKDNSVRVHLDNFSVGNRGSIYVNFHGTAGARVKYMKDTDYKLVRLLTGPKAKRQPAIRRKRLAQLVFDVKRDLGLFLEECVERLENEDVTDTITRAVRGLDHGDPLAQAKAVRCFVLCLFQKKKKKKGGNEQVERALPLLDVWTTIREAYDAPLVVTNSSHADRACNRGGTCRTCNVPFRPAKRLDVRIGYKIQKAETLRNCST